MSDQTSDHGWAPLANVRMEIQFAPDVGAETLVRLVKSAIMNARLALKVVGLDLDSGSDLHLFLSLAGYS